MKNALKKYLPSNFYQSIRYPLLLKRSVLNHLYDTKNFLKNSCLSYRPDDSISYSAILTMEYHKLEKALTLPQPKEVYGKEIAERIIKLIISNISHANSKPIDTDIALKALDDYIGRIKGTGTASEVEYANKLSERLDKVKSMLAPIFPLPNGKAGVLNGARSPDCHFDFINFNKSRKSVRNFSERQIPTNLIYQAIENAKYTPSVCNRQPWHAYYIDSKPKIVKALGFQNGSNGFRERVPGLIVICSSIKHFPLSGERNQMWIDGGMFAMNVLLSLHACGLGACALNWGNDSSIDQAAKKAIGLEDHEVIIMMIAVGYPSEDHLVCASHRRDTEEFLTHLD